MDFMLNLILTFTDNASGPLNQATSSIQGVTNSTQGMDNSLKNIEGMASLTSLGVSADQTGRAFMSMGKSIGGVLTGLVQKVISVGSEFESFGITMNQLYKDEAKVDKQMSKLLQFSAKSPFEVDDVKDLMVVLKSQGLEAFDSIKGEVTNTKQETLAWIGDLMAFKPDIPASRWRLAFTNYLGSGAPKVLQNLLDMGSIEETIGHSIGDTAEDRLNSLVEFIEKKDLGGLMSKMFGTWQQSIANMDDVFTMLYRDIGNTGAFDNFKAALQNIANVLIDLDKKGKLQQLAVSLGEALDPIAKMAIKATDFLADLIEKVVDFAAEHPKLMQMATVFLAISSALLVVGGAALMALGKVAFAINMINQLGVVFGGFGAKLLPLILLAGLFGEAWSHNLGGIRDDLTDFGSKLSTTFETAFHLASLSAEELKFQLDNLDSNTNLFPNLTKDITGFLVLLELLADGWSDNEVEFDTYNKAVILGVDEIGGKILDLKQNIEAFIDGFIKGFKKGSKELGNFVKEAGKKIEEFCDKIGLGDVFDDLTEGVKGFFEQFTKSDTKGWEKMGETIGRLTPIVLGLIGAFMVLKGLMGIGDIFGSILGKGDSSKNVDKFTEKTGGMLAFGAAVMMVGAGFWLMADGAAKVAEAGGEAIGVLALMSGTILVLMAAFSYFGETLTQNIGGLLAFGAATLMAGAGLTLMAYGATMVASAGPAANTALLEMLGGVVTLAVIFGVLGGRLTQGAAGMIAFGVAVLLAGAGMLMFAQAATMLASGGDAAQSALAMLTGVLVVLMVGMGALAGLGLGAVAVMLAFGAAVLMVGAGISLAATGLSTLVQNINSLNNVGTLASDLASLAASLGLFAGAVAVAGGAALVAAPGFAALAVELFAMKGSAASVAASFSTISGSIQSVSAGVQSFTSIVQSFISGLGSAKTAVEQFGTSMTTAATTVSSAASSMSSSFTKIANSARTQMNAAVAAVTSGVARMRAAMNFSWSLPHLKVPHVSVSGSFSLDPPSAPNFSVAWYKQGGIFDSPQVIGVGEDGKEAVVPLEKNTEWIAKMAQKFIEYLPMNVNEPTETESMLVPQEITPTAASTVDNAANAAIVNTPAPAQNTDARSIDNSVHFEAGSIVIQSTGGVQDAEMLAEQIMQYIARRQRIQNDTNYGIQYTAGAY